MKNQILSTRINKKSNKKFFKFQFLISIFIIVILIGFICYSSISLLKKEQMLICSFFLALGQKRIS